MTNQHWTEHQLRLLIDPSLSNAEAARLCGKSLHAVEAKRRRLIKAKVIPYRSEKNAHKVPVPPPEAKPKKPDVRPEEHAETRARTLASEITSLVTSSKWPVVNPEAIVVESFLSRRYDRRLREHVSVEGTPRTWISDTLRVSPIPDHRGRKFLFTGAQNDSEVHAQFWANLNAYAKAIGAEIVVGPWTYETQWWAENNATSRSYAPELAEHLCFGQLEVGPDFVFCGEMNTLPTASRPISDLVTYSRGRWAVFPHARLQLKSVPSPDPRRQAHQVMTTGACTKPKVIARKAGVKSIFHHIIGATLVEFDLDGDIFCRQINASDDGSFFDLDVFVDAATVLSGYRAKAIVFGDVHMAKVDAEILDSSLFRKHSLLRTLRPEYAFLHDLHDQEIGNHHSVNDVHHRHELETRGRTSIKDEIAGSAWLLRELDRVGVPKVVVVDSNHDLALERYVREARYRGHGENLAFGLELDLAYTRYREEVARALDAKQEVPKFSLFEHAVRQTYRLENVEWAYDGHSYLVDGVECGHHGFRGANGAKGTVDGFAKIGRKMTIGDKHSPEILDGVYVAGVLSLQHGYNKGPSGWAVSCVVQYPNGKRTLITFQRGKWRA